MNPSEPPRQHLHPVAAIISLLRTLRALLPLFVVLLISEGAGASKSFAWVALLAIVFGLVEGVGGWLRFSYWIENGQLHVERGFLVRQKVLIPAERVQTVDLSAGVLQRLFGLVKAEVKTAAGTQVVFSALDQPSASELRQLLSREAAATRSQPGSQPTSRYVLSSGALLLAASTSGRLGVLLSGVAWMYSKVDDLIERRLVEFFESLELSGLLAARSPLFFVALASFGFLLAFLASVVAEVARFGGFQVVRTGDQLVISRGIFERREISVALHRIQAIRIVESLVRQPLGYAAIIVETAGHAEERGQSTQLHPFLHRSQWLPLLRALAPEHAISPSLLHPPRRALRRFLLKPTLGACVVVAFSSLSVPYGWLTLPLVVLGPYLGYLAYRDAAVGIQGHTLLLRRRLFGRVTAIVRRGRIQFSEQSSSLLQRRRALSTLTIAVASGTGGKRFSVPDMDADTVRGLTRFCAGAVSSPQAESP